MPVIGFVSSAASRALPATMSANCFASAGLLNAQVSEPLPLSLAPALALAPSVVSEFPVSIDSSPPAGGPNSRPISPPPSTVT